jgi:hypothetical protein
MINIIIFSPCKALDQKRNLWQIFQLAKHIGYIRMKSNFRNLILSTGIGLALLMPLRLINAINTSNIISKICAIILWIFKSREYGGSNYITEPDNQIELCYIIANISNRRIEEIISYRDELAEDDEIKFKIMERISNSNEKYFHDPVLRIGKRLKFYLLVRALRPQLTIEAGVDRGLGALIIDRALQRNASEGYPGRYLGIEINRDKNILFIESVKPKFGTILFGDSVNEIDKIEEKIDLFFHETLSNSEHVKKQLTLVRNKMSDKGVITTPWSNYDILQFSIDSGMNLLAHRDRPKIHWHDGATHLFIFPSPRY